MVFERVKAAFGGQPAGPGQRLREALLPIRAVSDELYRRAVGFVHDGSGPEVLLELDPAHAPDLRKLMGDPGVVTPYQTWIDDKLGARLRQAGVTGRPRQTVPHLRSQLYRDPQTSQPEFLRLGRLLAVIGTGPNRRVDGVPLWLTALLNDLTKTVGPDAAAHLTWPPERFADLLRHDGAPEAEIPALVFLAVSEQERVWGGRTLLPHALPGIDNYLLGFGHLIDPAALDRLSALGRTGVAERAAANPQVAPVMAAMLAHLSVDPAKGVRAAAVEALQVLPWPAQVSVLGPVLQRVPAARAAELIEYLSRGEAGAELLGQAVAAGGRIGAAVEKADARRRALRSAPAQQPLVIPPFTPFPDDLDADRAVTSLRRHVDAAIARLAEPEADHAVRRLRQLRAIGDADLRAIVTAAAGRGPRPAVVNTLSAYQIARAVPEFNPVHLIRLQPDAHAAWVAQARPAQVTDLRQLHDALLRAGASQKSLESLPNTVRPSRYWYCLPPEQSWAWFAERPEVLQKWLGGQPADVTDALSVLEGFPTIPPPLLPTVSAVALGQARVARRMAQALLARHGAARELAEQGLGDSHSELRAASAAWLGSLADPDGIPALRAALGRERRDVPRAAMLNALRDLGDDISADLAPERLLAEATKGLRAKPSPTLDWFGFDQLPGLRWRDGDPVDPAIPRWWVVLANKIKNPDGSGLFDLYLARLDDESAAALGRFVLDSWIAQDTRHPTEEESRRHAEIAGRARYDRAQQNLRRVQGNAQQSQYLDYLRGAAAVPVEQHVGDVFAEHQGTYLGSAAGNRGLLALTTRMPGIELANAVQGYIRHHGARRAQVDALMHPLYANGQPAAVQLLLSIARRFKQASVQATAARLVETLADKRGWSADELADRTIPTAGFDADGLLRLDFGSREFIGRASPAGTISLATTDGKPVKTLPAARAADDPELVKAAKKQLTTARKELKAVVAQQTARLYEAMCAERTWRAAEWRSYLLEHPLAAGLVSRLVWLSDPGPGQRAFRPTDDGELVDIDDGTVDLPGDAVVALAHRVRLDEAAAQAWRAHLDDYEVTPLFAQFDNPSPQVDPQATELTTLRGHLTDTFSFRGVATKRGYQRGPAEDGAWFSEYTKGFPAAGLTVVQEFTGSYVPEENFACATVALSFRGDRHRAVPLGEVPPVLLAECHADYAALAALGPFDPQWEKKAGL